MRPLTAQRRDGAFRHPLDLTLPPHASHRTLDPRRHSGALRELTLPPEAARVARRILRRVLRRGGLCWVLIDARDGRPPWILNALYGPPPRIGDSLAVRLRRGLRHRRGVGVVRGADGRLGPGVTWRDGQAQHVGEGARVAVRHRPGQLGDLGGEHPLG
jgi:hypothetical protein